MPCSRLYNRKSKKKWSAIRMSDKGRDMPGPQDGAGVLGPGLESIVLSVNGRDVVVRADPAMTLAEVLRDHLSLTGTKIGCDRGACSACTVWLDGDVVASCMTFALDARGRAVRTIESLAGQDSLHPV